MNMLMIYLFIHDIEKGIKKAIGNKYHPRDLSRQHIANRIMMETIIDDVIHLFVL